MPKGTSAGDYRKKNTDDLITDLKKLREELQNIRFTKVSGTAVTKLSKIKILRKQIARVLTIIRENKKKDIISRLRVKIREDKTSDPVKKVETTVKNLKFKHLPLDLRPKKTRALRRKMTRFESKLMTLRQLKRKLNFPRRKFAVPFQ